MTLPCYTPNAQWLVPASQPLALLQGIQALVTLTGSGNRLGGGGGGEKQLVQNSTIWLRKRYHTNYYQ